MVVRPGPTRAAGEGSVVSTATREVVVDGARKAEHLVVVTPADRVVNESEQTPGMRRESGVTPETTDSSELWAGYVVTPPSTVSGAHHHGDAESAIFMLSGRALFRWGPRLEHERIAGPGDFVYVPPGVVHSEENLSADEPVVFVVARNSGTMTTVNVDIPEDDDRG